jgi:ATP-dependent Lon protease
VFLLDEIDKLGADFRGDPSAALLEVLDPEQNHAFVDHYLDVEYDLSKVMFIATANVVHPIPPALRDRMEIISLSGYTPNEKLAIARQFLVPKQVKENGLTAEQAVFDDSGLYALIEKYTREAGVRNLEREIASVCRKIARKVVAEEPKEPKEPKEAKGPITVTSENLSDFLGKAKHRPAKKGEKAEVGLSTGLAWTEAGGDVLHIETTLMRGKGNLVLTGQLGDVMQESARAALSYVRSRAEMYGADPDFYEKKDIHVHIPEGAIPKDGPSAGITMATSILSAVTNIACRKDLAMTGEITLRGKVLPVGGIKEKLLAAYRAGITTIILPRENEKDLDDLPDEIRTVLECHLVDDVDEVVRLALETTPVAAPPKAAPAEAGTTPPTGLAH